MKHLLTYQIFESLFEEKPDIDFLEKILDKHRHSLKEYAEILQHRRDKNDQIFYRIVIYLLIIVVSSIVKASV